LKVDSFIFVIMTVERK